MFPQLGRADRLHPVDRVLHPADATFMSEADFLAWGWRIPFLASAVLVFVGLWVRLKITETPEFQKVVDQGRAGARRRS